MQFRAVDVASGSERSNLDPAIARPTPIQFPPVTHVIVALCDGVRMTGLEEPWNRFLNPASYLLAHIEGVAPEATTGGGDKKCNFLSPTWLLCYQETMLTYLRKIAKLPRSLPVLFLQARHLKAVASCMTPRDRKTPNVL